MAKDKCVRCSGPLGPFPRGGVCTACLMVEALRQLDPKKERQVMPPALARQMGAEHVVLIRQSDDAVEARRDKGGLK